MIQFVSITSFRKRLAALLKVKRGIYAGVTDEICQAFKHATIEQIRQNRDMILINNDVVIIKLRMPDKKQKLSKADGSYATARSAYDTWRSHYDTLRYDNEK